MSLFASIGMILYGTILLVAIYKLYIFYRVYPYRCIIEHKRAGKDPVLGYDRAGRIKTKSGAEVFRLYSSRHAGKRIDIMPPNSEFIITGKGFFNKMTLPLFEDSGNYVPMKMDFGESYVKMKPIPHRTELDRIAMHHQANVWHDTRSGFEKAKPLIIGAGVFIVIVFLVIILSRKPQIFQDFGSIFGQLIPITFMFKQTFISRQ